MNHLALTVQAFERLGLRGDGTQKMLDVGCRYDYMKKYFTDRGFEWNGSDMKPLSSGITECKMECMPMYQDESFDLIWVCHAFEHCERPVDAMREFKRLLKPTGTLFISTPMHCEHQVLRADSDHIMVLTGMQLIRLGDYAGFKKVAQLNEWNEGGQDEAASSLITVFKKDG